MDSEDLYGCAASVVIIGAIVAFIWLAVSDVGSFRKANASAEIYNATHKIQITGRQVQSLGIDEIEKRLGANKPEESPHAPPRR